METFVAPPKEAKAEENGLLKKIADYKIDFSFDDRKAISYIPFFLFLTFLGVVYIANSYYADNLNRQITESEKRVEELRVDYNSYKYEYMLLGKPEEMQKRVKGLGLISKDKPVIRIDLTPKP